MKALVAFVVGLLFALGLGLSGMTQTQVVKGFLDIAGDWNLNLIGVMVGAITVHSLVYQWTKRRASPLFDVKFHLPTRKEIDLRLILGAALFGLGWGWAGICPGPALVSAVTADQSILIFIASMMAGMGLFKLVEKRL